MSLDARAEAFWQAYLASLSATEDAVRMFYEVFRFGDTADGANEGVALIRKGVKTATSSLLWTYEALNKPLPLVGSLSIVTDGDGSPCHVVETIAVDIMGFAEVDAAFAYDYGEWDRTLETWRARCWELNTPRCRVLGKVPTPEMPMVCERFVVVYPHTA